MIIERKIYQKIKKFIHTPEAVVITGMRRVGKTTLLKYISKQIDSQNQIFLDLENTVNRKYFEEDDYEKIFDHFQILGLDPRSPGYVFLDEIQFVKNLPSVVKYLIDHHQIKFFLSGSASFYLKNVFSESLSGRKYIFELFPLSFREFLQLKGVKFRADFFRRDISEAIFQHFNRYYDEYLLYGGFPQVIEKVSVQEKELMLDEIFSSYFQLEVVQFGDFRKSNIVRDLLLLLMERTGSKLDIQKLSRELGVSRTTIEHYIAFLEGTYFIKLIRPFSRNRDSEIRSMPKCYICDSGLIHRFARVSDGALFENAVCSVLSEIGELNYYQKKSGSEIDFILDKQYGYEVKSQPHAPDILRLRKLSKELGLKKYRVVSRKYSTLDPICYGFQI